MLIPPPTAIMALGYHGEYYFMVAGGVCTITANSVYWSEATSQNLPSYIRPSYKVGAIVWMYDKGITNNYVPFVFIMTNGGYYGYHIDGTSQNCGFTVSYKIGY